MNIFMMIIMTAMFGAFQYFMTRRTEGYRFDREEMGLRTEMNCLRRFHDFASGENVHTLNLDTGGVSRIGPDGHRLDPGFTCAGSDRIRSYKYCLDAEQRRLIHCADLGQTGFHCVSTIKMSPFPPARRALLFQMNMAEIRNGMLSGRPLPLPLAEGGYGMTTCVSASMAEARSMGLLVCAAGFFSRLQENGEWECAPIPRITPCTAHEEEIEARDAIARQGCTEMTGGNFCCAREPGDICGRSRSIRAVWDPSTRSFRCVNADDACPGRLYMQLRDERGDDTEQPGLLTDAGLFDRVPVNAPFTARYDERRRAFDCVPNRNMLTRRCRDVAEQTGFFYISVDNIGPGQTPVCRLSSTETAARRTPTRAARQASPAAPRPTCGPHQVFQGGECITRWCIGIPRTIDVRIGQPTDVDCFGIPTHPFMAYNSEEGWNCVYCTRLPPN